MPNTVFQRKILKMMTEVEDGDLTGTGQQIESSGQIGKELPPPDVTSHENKRILGLYQ